MSQFLFLLRSLKKMLILYRHYIIMWKHFKVCHGFILFLSMGKTLENKQQQNKRGKETYANERIWSCFLLLLFLVVHTHWTIFQPKSNKRVKAKYTYYLCIPAGKGISVCHPQCEYMYAAMAMNLIFYVRQNINFILYKVRDPIK